MQLPNTVPTSRESANTVLNQILDDRGTANDFAITGITNALDLIALQLYSKSTPFIAELIQNADDNKFNPDSVPSLEFTLIPDEQNNNNHVLLVECNDSPGLTCSQVDSLAHVGNSTKAQQADSTTRQQTGEKGIGFKSVFKIADVVDVCSGFFEFRLDNTKKLGMLRPLIHDFPRPKRPGWTQFLLHLRTASDYDTVKKSLEALKPQQLLFLRSLRVIKVTAPDFQSTYNTDSQPVAQNQNAEIKTLVSDDSEGVKKRDYFLLRTIVKNMPTATEGRLHVSSAELVLGFPISPPEGNEHPTQNAYAFLPIRDFGFRFIIQADFVVAASREDLEWNITLRDTIPSAFATAVRYFNSNELHPKFIGQLAWARYHWPELLLYTRDDAFWGEVTSSIAETLSGRPVLETRAGSFKRCNEVLSIPSEYRTQDGTLPMIDLQSRLATHLSFKYNQGNESMLLKIFGIKNRNTQDPGIKKMNSAMFRRDLDEFINNDVTLCDGRTFAAVDSVWRDLVATPFKTEHLKPLMKLRLVPIHDEVDGDTWVKPGDNIFFSTPRVSVSNLAKNLDFYIVDRGRCSGPEWERLVRELKVKDLDPAAAIDKIRRQHQDQSQKRKFLNWTKDAILLFRARSHIPEDFDLSALWFLTNGNKKRLRGSEIYLKGCPLLAGPMCTLSDDYTGLLSPAEHIYDPTSSTWRSTTAYVRNKPDCILGHDALPEQYRDFETLFGRYARVRTITSQDVLAEIQELSPDGHDNNISMDIILRAKALIQTLDDALRAEAYILPDGSAKALLKCAFLPARTDAGVELCTAAKCYIPDDTSVQELFASHFAMVDTTLQDIAQLQPLIDCLGLKRRLLSVAATRDTQVNRATINNARTEELRRKMQWFCKLSDSPTEEMLASLAQTTVWDVKTITVTYSLEAKTAKRTTDAFWVEKKTQPQSQINIYLSPKATSGTWAYIDQDLSSILAEDCKITKTKNCQLLPTLLRISADEIPALLDRQRINRAHFELVNGWMAPPDSDSDGTMSVGDPDVGVVEKIDDMEGVQNEDRAQDDNVAKSENAAQDDDMAQDDRVNAGASVAQETVPVDNVAQGRGLAQDDNMVLDADMNDNDLVDDDNTARQDHVAQNDIDDQHDVFQDDDVFDGFMVQDDMAQDEAALSAHERHPVRSSFSPRGADAVLRKESSSRPPSRAGRRIPRPSTAGSSTGFATPRRRTLPDEDDAEVSPPKRSCPQTPVGFAASGCGDDDDAAPVVMEPGPATPGGQHEGQREGHQLNMTVDDAQVGPSLAANIKGENIAQIHELCRRQLAGWNDDEHWTGRLNRERQGSLPRKDLPSYFTYKDFGDGGMVTMMEELGLEHPHLDQLKGKTVTYHIDIKATEGKFKEPFTMTWSQHTMARNLMIGGSVNPEGSPPKDVYVLMRICRVDDIHPDIHVRLDHWSDIRDGKHTVRYSEAVVTPETNRFYNAMSQ
ncbi:hypothetical protein F5X68DRAFT_238913 [Plectosphaerella plurivora]|uniref:Uncharacterized protein n=1 Tax=Plectosphaerella plurivora TaxID=936078 RepID=A0A9P9AH95_9PEZI|nr:hypothetical protein F5X68DRAFT_238913 [Plectosphaerella plurivora]